MSHRTHTAHTGVNLTPFLRIVLALAVLLPAAACNQPTGQPVQATSTPTGTLAARVTASPTPAGATRPTAVPTSVRSTPLPTPSLDIQPSALRGVRVQFWHPWAGEAGRTLESRVAEFNRGNSWGITASVTGYQGLGALEDAVNAAFLAENPPNLLAAYTYQAIGWDVGRTTLVDLQAYTSDPQWGLAETDVADFYPAFWDADLVTLPGEQADVVKRLGVPLHRLAVVIFYNRTWAEELGFSNPPVSSTGLRIQACAAARSNNTDVDKDNNNTGGWLLTPQPGVLTGWVQAFGGQVSRADGQGYQLDTPPAQQALEFIKGLQEDGCAWRPGTDDPAAAFASRRALFYAASTSDLPALTQAFTQASSTDEWIAIPFPSEAGTPAVVAYGPSLSVVHTTSVADLAAWELLKWLVTPASQAQWAQAGNYLPARAAARTYLSTSAAASEPWVSALNLLPYASPEPTYPSWPVVRRLLVDALQVFYDPLLKAEGLPDFLSDLDALVADVHNQVR